jgi:hypothetical protein
MAAAVFCFYVGKSSMRDVTANNNNKTLLKENMCKWDFRNE